jgi:hypothetical protein
MAEHWRTLAASHWTGAPPQDCDLDVDYERLLRKGRVVERTGRYADFYEAADGDRAKGWWAALVEQARDDRLALYSVLFVEVTLASRRWFGRRRSRFHLEDRTYAPMAELLDERTGLTVSDAASLLTAP